MYQSEKLINNLYDAIVFWLTEWSVKNRSKEQKRNIFLKRGTRLYMYWAWLAWIQNSKFWKPGKKKKTAQLYELITRLYKSYGLPVSVKPKIYEGEGS